MKNRIKILTLTFLFVLSTTGLPLVSHYCSVIGKSYSKCPGCEDSQKVVSNCCEEEAIIYRLIVKDQTSTCCFDQFEYKKIEDNFSQSNFKLVPGIKLFTILDNQLPSENENVSGLNPDKNENLPPPRFGKKLLQKLHQLKVDLPVC
ncbi:MAG: hypothetical protein IPM56_12275 [Ignavibacteriales bacterium]|nr:MAG: hypothetical protein IPM56_12275 [Ignavibacteriales bacterium]